MEKQQEHIRSVYGGSLSLSTVINFLYIFSAIFNFNFFTIIIASH